MNATPTNRLKLTPSNSPYLQRPSRSPLRGRPHHESRLALKRVVGTTCVSPTGFDAVQSSFAYIAGGAVVVVDVDGEHYSQRFYRARPTAQPVYGATHSHSASAYAPSTPTSTPKANDSRNRVALGARESFYGSVDWSESPTSRTWTSRERIKAATCLALSRDGKYLAVGETGYAPRVLIFGLEDNSSDTPLVSISEHAFGVKAIAWSADTRWLASLGTANDGFLYLWRVDARTGAAKLHQQNRCTSTIKGMVWMGNNLVTFGVRHIKVWKADDAQAVSPVKQKFASEPATASHSNYSKRKALPGRNVLLGPLLAATFTCAVAVDDSRIVVCSEGGDVCIVDDHGKQARLLRCINLDFPVASITIRHATVYVGGKSGQFATLSLRAVLDCLPECVLTRSKARTGLVAMGFLIENLVIIDAKRSIDIWSSSYIPGETEEDDSHIQLPGHGDQILGIQALPKPNVQDAAFLTWSGSGRVVFWDLDGRIKSSLHVPLEQVVPENDMDTGNQLNIVRATRAGKLLLVGDKLGVLKVIDAKTQQCLLETKAHAADCQSISVYEDDSKFLMASCGRDRTTQLFHRSSRGAIEHVQTLDSPAKVVKVHMPSDSRIITCSLDRSMQIYDVVRKEEDPNAIAALNSRHIALKASPTSFVLGEGDNTAFVSMLDRSVCQYDLATGKQLSSFRCVDERGVEAAILDSLTASPCPGKEGGILLGLSNTDKSVRLYDAQTGSFIDREWGHTEAINGVALVDDEDGYQNVVSVGSDGTMMRWGMDMQEYSPGSTSRDPSPVKSADSVSARPPLRRVLSKAELAEFQRPSPTTGRRSPPRTLNRRTSRYGLNLNSAVTPKGTHQSSPSGTIAENDTPCRRLSSNSPSNSPPQSPKSRVSRRPSLPALSINSRKKSSPSLRSGGAGGPFGSLSMATEQACRTLRAYRKKLALSVEPVSEEALAELGSELRLTAAALSDRAVRDKAISDSVISGLVDQLGEHFADQVNGQDVPATSPLPVCER
ncbi:WD repeat-containing protein [Sodiomyces alkalinus F11]|uniref:WD repeat-containing protein n=1 Tax=Sodiomyces alkalinus (strain CBS 110278 / VKM F-3762 / F11) TaxID=1314773 RepID=A0A3N2Q9D1_SODAK|nr:WD repeat-containing protein [Sodiomyces alkalinus F11]ROT43268.1 WD repeat-containing protein [Sodiomyces alkalinus F11]